MISHRGYSNVDLSSLMKWAPCGLICCVLLFPGSSSSRSVNAVLNSRKPHKDGEIAGVEGKDVVSNNEKQGNSARNPSAENNKPSSEPIVELPTTSATADDTLSTSAVVENISFCGDADSTMEVIQEDDESPFGNEGSDDGDYQSDLALVSVGKQIWNFFTT